MNVPESHGERIRLELTEVLYSVAYLAPWDPDYIDWEADSKHDVVKQYLLENGDPRKEEWDEKVYSIATSEIMENPQ
jgi:hypothetical protein